MSLRLAVFASLCLFVCSGCSLSNRSSEKTTETKDTGAEVSSVDDVGTPYFPTDEELLSAKPKDGMVEINGELYRRSQLGNADTVRALKDIPALTDESSKIVGDWEVMTGGNYETITLSMDGTFMTHLHEKPFLEGVWTLSQGKLSLLVGDDHPLNEIYTSVIAIGDGLVLESSDGNTSEWMRKFIVAL